MSLPVSNLDVAASPTENAAGSQVNFTVVPLPGESIGETCRRLAGELKIRQAAPLLLLAFGNLSAYAATREALRKNFGRVDWPVTWVEGAACDGSSLAGLQVFGFTGKIERLTVDGEVVGSVFTTGGVRQCLVGGLSPARNTNSRADQTAETLEKLQATLALAGFELADVIRTWFFLEDILAWYDEFNRARTKIYSGVKFRTGSLPASTGVGAKNPAGTALALAAWAVRPETAGTGAHEVASPLQCPAPAYGSSFSRAMALTAAGRQLLISGTASIAPGGKTLWLDDPRKQVELTMDVVAAILHAQGFTLADLTRATAYFKHQRDAGIFREWCRENGLHSVPVVFAHCAVCRDDLLNNFLLRRRWPTPPFFTTVISPCTLHESN